MRASCIKQISSLGVVLPFDYNHSMPFSLTPIVFYKNPEGIFIKTVMQTYKRGDELFFDKMTLEKSSIPAKFDSDTVKAFNEFAANYTFELVFVKRNYDGTDTYYLIHDLTSSELHNFTIVFNKLKGGIIL